MRVLLLSANRERSPYPVFPIGLAYLAGPLAAAGHTLSVLDICFCDDPLAAVAESMDSFRPETVVLSLRNIDNVTFPGSRPYLAGVREVVDRCRAKARVIVGGSGFSLMPVEVLAYLDADYGVVGEGETVLPRLLAALTDGIDPAALPGVLSRGKETFLPPQPVPAIGTPLRELFDLARYHREGGMANLQTKRGCPFACVYCTYPLLEGKQVRLRPIPEIIAEIRELVANGVSYLYFVDDIFNYPIAFSEALCRAMTEARLAVNWSAFINPDFLPPHLLEAMLAAGCDALEFGTDSGSPAMLQRLGKSFDVDSIRAASRLCREAGVDFAHYILFGGPGENSVTVRESFRLMDELEPTAVIAMTGIRIFPGTAIHRQALAEGQLAPADSLLEPVFYLSESARQEICALVTQEALTRKNWVVPGLEINISDAMLAALRHFPVRGPLWKLVKRLGRTRVNPFDART